MTQQKSGNSSNGSNSGNNGSSKNESSGSSQSQKVDTTSLQPKKSIVYDGFTRRDKKK